MCSSGLEALTCLFSTKFLRCTYLRFTSSPAIATYMLLCFRHLISLLHFVMPPITQNLIFFPGKSFVNLLFKHKKQS
jgi:hypothetical protein